MPEEQIYERIERAYDMPEYMQAEERIDLRGPMGQVGDRGIETAELHVDGNTFTVNATDIGIDMGALWREAMAVTRKVKIKLREHGVEREVYISPDSVYDVDFYGEGVLLVGSGEDDVIDLTNRGYSDARYNKLLKKVGELTNSTDPIERAVALKVVGLMCEVGL